MIYFLKHNNIDMLFKKNTFILCDTIRKLAIIVYHINSLIIVLIFPPLTTYLFEKLQSSIEPITLSDGKIGNMNSRLLCGS